MVVSQRKVETGGAPNHPLSKTGGVDVVMCVCIRMEGSEGKQRWKAIRHGCQPQGHFSRETKPDVLRVFISTGRKQKWKSDMTLVSVEATRGICNSREIKVEALACNE